MIIRRYLVKQVVSTSLVVIALLTLIMMGGRLIKYFGVAAQGRLDAGILFSIIGYRLPEFLTLILPLGFFIGLMLVFGRLYVDHEMAVLNGSGVSRNQLGATADSYDRGVSCRSGSADAMDGTVGCSSV